MRFDLFNPHSLGERTINNLAFKYSIRRSQRVKNTRLVVTPDKIEVVAPPSVSERKIHAFVKSKQDWVIVARDKVVENKQSIKKQRPDSYTDGVIVPYKGQDIALRLKPEKANSLKIEANNQELNLYLPSQFIANNEFIRQTLIDWLKAQALKAVEECVGQYAQKYSLHPRFIRIKTQKSRWGSCGIHNDININWLLILAPTEVLEYVVIHEICHIKERNHSARFWRLVEAHLPEYQKQRNWLKKNGHNLMQGL
jgi:predicted metal-dependent hydrolase